MKARQSPAHPAIDLQAIKVSVCVFFLLASCSMRVWMLVCTCGCLTNTHLWLLAACADRHDSQAITMCAFHLFTGLGVFGSRSALRLHVDALLLGLPKLLYLW